MTWSMQALRQSMMLHVNSSCPLDVIIHPKGADFGLTDVKKLATLVWLIEKDLFLPLWPRHENDTAARPPLMTTHADVLRRPLEGVAKSRPCASKAAVMDEIVPRLRDDETQEMIHRIWACEDVSELTEALCKPDGNPLAFSILAVPAASDEESEPDPDEPEPNCIIIFRYGIWHPYPGIDPSFLWLNLVYQTCNWMRIKNDEFKMLLRRIDSRLQNIDMLWLSDWARLELLLADMGLDPGHFDAWRDVLHEHRMGGRLSREQIDMQPVLEPGL